jgi:hypothetical protein
LFLGCQSQVERRSTSDDLEVIRVFPSLIEQPFDYSSILDTARILRLETNIDCLIGNVDKIQIYNDRIYILDKKSAKSLFVFNILGEYLFKICEIGRGPGEFISPRDFSIDTLNRHILIADNSANKILQYDYDGSFIKDTSLDFNFTGSYAYLYPNKHIFDVDGSHNSKYGNAFLKKLIVTDDKFSIKSSYINSVKWQEYFIQQPYKLHSTNNSIYYTPMLVDTIFEINPTGLKGRYYIDFGNSKIDVKSYTESALSDKEILREVSLSKSLAFNILGFVENANYIFFNFLYNPAEQMNYVYYHKQDKDILYYNSVKLNEYTLGLYLPSTSFKQEFVFVVEPNILKRDFYKLESSGYKFSTAKAKERLEQMISSINDEENPLLIFCSFKK